jgi:hypothetical protein
VGIDWYNSGSRTYGYKIAVSVDGTNFTTVVDESINSVFGDTLDIISAVARYVRVTVTSCTQAGGYASFYECKVYGADVSGFALPPAHLTAVASGKTLTLSWSKEYLGWRLLVQTNTLPAGWSTNWVALPGSDLVTSTNININPANGTVFYRLVYP